MARGIVTWGAYVPHHRLERATVRDALGTGPGTGSRAVASHDEDSTTMAVEASRIALADLAESAPPGTVVLSTTAPAYVDKTNATVVHAALGLPLDVVAFDAGGAVRSGVASLRLALEAPGRSLAVSSDIRIGLPGSVDERSGGDGAAAFVCGEGPEVAATFLGAGTASAEFLDRWRLPGSATSRVWEERFGEGAYLEVGEEAWQAALKAAGVDELDVTTVGVTSANARAAATAARRRAADGRTIVDDLTAPIGHTGAAHAGLLLARMLDDALPGDVLALLSLADGADVLLFRATDAVTSHRPVPDVMAQVGSGRSGLPYTRFLSWRGLLTVEPPRRPEPDRPAAPPSYRSADWKLGFSGSRCCGCGKLHLPPQRVCLWCGRIDDMAPERAAGRRGRIANFTVDHLAFTPSPPMVAGLVDLDGGGRFQGEFADVDPAEIAVGAEMELTFRRLYTAEQVHNYFWKARPVRGDRS